MDVFLEILTAVGLMFLGSFIYTAFKLRDKVRSLEFSFKRLFKENVNFWIWILAMELCLSIAIVVVPDIKPSLETLVGIAFDHSKTSFITAGIALAGGTNELKQSKKVNGKSTKASKTL